MYGNYQLIIYKDNTQDDNELNPKKDIERDYDIESTRRAKRTVLELALNNSFDWFVTFTFHTKGSLINDRKDFEDIKKKFLKSINNYNRLYDTKLDYIACPELHANKQGVHFHCLMKGLNTTEDFTYVGKDSKTHRSRFRSKYFLERFGANYGVRIFDYNKFVAFYVSKYITKQDDRIFFRRFFRSNGLQKSFVIKRGLTTDYFEGVLVPSYESPLLKLYEFDDLDLLTKVISL